MAAIVYENMSNDEYHDNKGSISRSGIVEFMESPFRYFKSRFDPEHRVNEQTRAMIFGSAFHVFVLERHLFDDQYVVKPDPVLLKNVGREKYDAYKAQCETIENSDRIVITAEEYRTLVGMRNAVKEHPEASALIEDGLYEHSIFWDDARTGLKLKTRPDVWHGNMTVDLKTISSADPRTFQNAMAQHGYHLQSAMNREGINAATGEDIKKHVFVCVEKSLPFLVAVYILDETALDSAHNTLRRVLPSMKFCAETNQWPGYETQTIGLPAWAENL